ncbi:hypothetical protein [Elizabethkingia meningoseptica]|uniref:hypothetical protein n=1 Tax=Elizabethkingia meningoseptica TaxID=238 RepID=UPI0038919905
MALPISMKINNPKYISYYIDENFEFILTQIHSCYQKMLINIDKIENNENKIKNRLYKDYLNDQKVRDSLGLNGYLFKTETAFINDDYDEKGYSDIEVIDLKGSLKSTEAYYIIECKRLDDVNPHYKSSLNNKYISEGIQRFIEEKYPTHYRVNGMIAFIVKNIDIDKNSKHFTDLKKHLFIDKFEFSYRSKHKTLSNKQITLYHLMFDFSSKINPSLN